MCCWRSWMPTTSTMAVRERGLDRRSAMASCAITQNGFVRVISQPRYPSPVPVSEAIDRLARATRSKQHLYWSCELSLLDDARIDRTRIHGPRQATDVYLLALATANRGRLVTFDGSIPLAAVKGARQDDLVVP